MFLSTIVIGSVTPQDCDKFMQIGHRNSFLPVPFVPGSGFMNEKCKFITTRVVNIAKYGQRLYHMFYNMDSHKSLGVAAFYLE